MNLSRNQRPSRNEAPLSTVSGACGSGHMRLSGRFAILCSAMCFAVILTRRRVGSGTWRRGLPILLLFLLLPGCGRRTPSPSPVSAPSIPSGGFSEAGIASWYGPGFHGRTTANGESYDMYAMTAAHKTLPFDTWVRVVNLDNSESTVVRINDRGPFIEGRVIDLSRNAAEDISMVGPGTARVQLLIVDEPIRKPASQGDEFYSGSSDHGGSSHTEANTRRRREALSGSGWCFSQSGQRRPAQSQTGRSVPGRGHFRDDPVGRNSVPGSFGQLREPGRSHRVLRTAAPGRSG